MTEPVEITVAGEKFKVRKLPPYLLTKTLGNGIKDLADIDIDLVIAAVVDPKLKREDFLQFNEEKYYGLLEQVQEVNREGIRKLGNYMGSGRNPSQQKST